MGNLRPADDGFYHCMGDVKHTSPADNLCPDCEPITKDQYITAVLRKYVMAQDDARSTLMYDLRGIA